jgi:uroporphyrinogen III methyltransferase / synthase
VIGDVVNLRARLAWFDRKPLHGLRILVTRTRDQAGRLSAAVRACGAEPVECPLIETVPPTDWAPLDDAIARILGFDWIVFTSANGVEAFFARLALAELDTRALSGCRIAAIGPATAEALRAHGLRADWVPDEYVAEAVADGIGEVRGLHVLLARAEKARPVLAQRLSAAGAIVEEVAAYCTVRPDGLEAELRERLAGGVDVVTFTSSSTVQHFVEALGEGEAVQALDGICVACIGPITADTARRYGLTPSCVAAEYTIDGLVQALIAWHVASSDHPEESVGGGRHQMFENGDCIP